MERVNRLAAELYVSLVHMKSFVDRLTDPPLSLFGVQALTFPEGEIHVS